MCECIWYIKRSNVHVQSGLCDREIFMFLRFFYVFFTFTVLHVPVVYKYFRILAFSTLKIDLKIFHFCSPFSSRGRTFSNWKSPCHSLKTGSFNLESVAWVGRRRRPKAAPSGTRLWFRISSHLLSRPALECRSWPPPDTTFFKHDCVSQEWQVKLMIKPEWFGFRSNRSRKQASFRRISPEAKPLRRRRAAAFLAAWKSGLCPVSTLSRKRPFEHSCCLHSGELRCLGRSR